MAKTLPWLALAIVCLAPVVSGCLGSFGIKSSTVSAHFWNLAEKSNCSEIFPATDADSDCIKFWLTSVAAPLTTRRRRLRVVIYARYSTEEQDASSIDDQISYCKKCLAEIGITDVEFTLLDDREMSGELRHRPGIDQIWKGIEVPKWDLLVCEDAGRLFRNDSACIELIETAFDNGMRVICFNDDVDTDEEAMAGSLARCCPTARQGELLHP